MRGDVGHGSRTTFLVDSAAPARPRAMRRLSGMSRGRARFTESDLARIFKAASKAGVDVCVKIGADGSITIATGMPGELKGDAVNPWDEVLHDAAEQKRTA
jgi:putative heme degradation protein